MTVTKDASPGQSAAGARGEHDLARPQELADAMPQIVWTHDRDGAPTYVNRHWTDYTGLDLAETLRVGAHTLVHPDDLPEVARLMEASRSAGAAVEATYRLRRARDGAWRWHAARVVPLAAAEGRATSFVGTATDVDDQRRADEVQRFLLRAAEVLGTSLDLGKTLDDVARLVVPHLADWCAIDLLPEGGVLERAAVAHVDPAKVALAWDLGRRMPPRPDDPHGAYAVIRARRAERLEEIPDALLAASISDPDILAIARSLGLRSSMCVPLVARDRALGALSLVSAESGRRYGEGDMAFAEEFARRIAVAVDNAQLYAQATEARAVAEALATDVAQQSRAVETALLAMRAERDAALSRVEALERARGGSPGAP
ncbi:MAG: PAS domain-containing protein [Deltaproteobacteria bacterium]|nr:PAS domain-containing protein [Myxococcales bacterium]MDP3215114.1 PAS domain-containing protein [Deltaproteobacteria bacterium]